MESKIEVTNFIDSIVEIWDYCVYKLSPKFLPLSSVVRELASRAEWSELECG